ncbi:unnamed protein product [Ectocarpus sp. 13 AM-2016]
MRLEPLCYLFALTVLLPHQSSAFTPCSLSPAARTPPAGTCPRQQQHVCSRRHGAAAAVAAAPAGRFDQGGGTSRALGGVAGGRRRRRHHQGSSKLHMLDPGAAVAALSTAVAAGGAGADGAVSAWSVTSITSDFAAELFQASLFPYLAFLWLLSRKETKTPEGGTFGFAFLLVFVVATIPAGIYAKTEYNEILANVDYLHGIAESFLTLTNLFIVSAFRKAVVGKQPAAGGTGTTALRSSTAAAAVLALAAAPMMLAAAHAEPANALSFPTWMVHVSSLIEWLAAMTYVWRFADVSGLKEWKGLTWGMLPLHTSGLIACTYHIFYNAPELISLVAMQAGLTCFGNATMAFATWRVWQAGKEEWRGDEVEEAEAAAAAAAASEREASSSFGDDVPFYGQVLAITVVGAALVKWGELYLDFPFEPSYAAAAALILGPTALNAKKWADRSKDPSAAIEGII